MTKNMTRKGLALGAASALIVSGLVGAAPASAAGLYVASYVSLLPNAGTAYATLSSEAFDLKSNVVGSLQGVVDKNLKFLVTDPTEVLAVDVDVDVANAPTEVVVAQAATLTQASVASKTNSLVTFTVTTHGFVDGDSVEVTTGDDGIAVGVYAITSTGANTFTVTAANATGHSAAGNVVVKTASVTKAGSVVTIHEPAHGLVVGDSVVVTTKATAGVELGAYTVTTVPSINRFTFTADAVTLNKTQVPVVKTGDLADLDSRALIAKVSKISAVAHLGTATIASGTGITDGRKADGSFVIDTQTNSNSVNRLVRLVNTSATGATTAVTVTAWVDDNDDNAIDSTEYVSITQTVTFYATADLTVTSAINQPVIGDSTVTGTVSVTPALNGAQITTGTATAGIFGVSTVQAGATVVTTTWNATNANWDVSFTDNDNVEVGTFTFRAMIAGTNAGNTASVLVTTRTSADTSIAVAASADQQFGFDDNAGDGESNIKIRPTKTATAVVSVVDSADLAVAGKSVKVSFSGASTSTDFSVNGTKVLDNASTGVAYYTTDALGQVTLAISTTSGANGDTVILDVSPEGLATTAAASIKFTWETAVYDIVDLNAPVEGAARNLTKLGSINFDLAAVDQWGGTMTGDYRLQMTPTGQSDGTDTVSFSTGRASYTVTDEALTTGGSITLATQLQKLTSGTWGNSVDATDMTNVTITVSTAPTTSIVPSLAYSGAAAVDLTLKQIVAYNTEIGVTQLATLDTTNKASVSLAVGTGLAAGDLVTVSGADLWFSYKDGGVSGTVETLQAGSLTFVIDNATDVIGVHSNTYAKDKVITITANGRSATTKVTTGVAGPDTGTSVVVDAPSFVTKGSTFKVTATITDVFGNPVDATAGDVSVTYTGPGIVFGDLPTHTNAAGQLSFAVLLGSNDSGSGAVTVNYDLDGDGVLTDDVKNITVAKTVTLGVAPSDTKVNVGTFKGFVALYAKGYKGQKMSAIVAGKWIVVKSLASDFERVVRFTGAGYTITTKIYIDGVMIGDAFTTVTK
jgi:hypothetical protein